MVNLEQPQRPILGGTDGYRGVATRAPGPGLMNPATVAALSYVQTKVRLEQGGERLTVVGRDRRASGPALMNAAIAGILAAGGDVLPVGIAPTPTVQKLAELLEAGAGGVVTASHNPPKYNGWKYMIARYINGMLGHYKPSSDEVRTISNRYWEIVDSGLALPSEPVGRITEQTQLLDLYCRHVTESIAAEFGERPLEGKILVYDGANGAATEVTPKILEALGATVERFACCNDGVDNEHCGATHLEGLRGYLLQRPDLVRNPNFIGAMANDPDADRVMGLGAYIGPDDKMHFLELNGNHMMEMLAKNQPGMVGTDYTNDASIKRIGELGVEFEFCRNGDTNVTNALLEKQLLGQPWTRGIEFSGHIVDTLWLPSGDGIRTLAWVAAYAAMTSTNLYELAVSMPLQPENLINVELPKGTNAKALMGNQAILAAVSNAELALAGTSGRLLVRASGTEPVVRIWAVGPDENTVLTATRGIEASIKALAK